MRSVWPPIHPSKALSEPDLEVQRMWSNLAVAQRVARPLRKVHHLASRFSHTLRHEGVAHAVRRARNYLAAQFVADVAYRGWLERFDHGDDVAQAKAAAHAETFAHRPRFSILMPAYNSDPDLIAQAVQSVRDQVWADWELCIADDGSPRKDHLALLDEAAATDPRIQVHRAQVNSGIAVATNAAADRATGDWIVFLDHDDRLHPLALYHLAAAINDDGELRFLFSDEDKLDPRGKRTAPHFKGAFDPELFRCHNLVTHLAAVHRDVFQAVGGLRTGFDGAQDYDFVARVTDLLPPEQIRHIPFILYHWRMADGSTAGDIGAKPEAVERARTALRESLSRRGISGDIVEGPLPGHHFPIYDLPQPPPRVGIVIPTRDQAELLKACVASILNQTDYPDFEIIIVDNGSVEAETHDYFTGTLAHEANVRIVPADYPFNFSKLCNDGVAATDAELVLLLNNDTEVLAPDWLTMLAMHAARDENGAVGTLLLYEGGDIIQHGGVGMGLGGVAATLYTGLSAHAVANMGKAHLTQRMAAVTGACLMTRRALYHDLGGLDEALFAVAYNDVDYCLKVRDAGLHVVYEPRARMIHKESRSRGFEDSPEKQARQQREIDNLLGKWGDRVQDDPYLNPCYSRGSATFDLITQETRSLPWDRTP